MFLLMSPPLVVEKKGALMLKTYRVEWIICKYGSYALMCLYVLFQFVKRLYCFILCAIILLITMSVYWNN